MKFILLSNLKGFLLLFKDISDIHCKKINNTLAMYDCNTVVNSEQTQIKSGYPLMDKNISQSKNPDLFGSGKFL